MSKGRPKNIVHQLIVEHKMMKEALEYYRAKDIASLVDAKRGIEGKPWLDVPPLCDWSMAHRCLQEIESEENMKHTMYTCEICSRTSDPEPSMSNFIAGFYFRSSSGGDEISKINDVCVDCRAEITNAVRLAVNEVKARKGKPDKFKIVTSEFMPENTWGFKCKP